MICLICRKPIGSEVAHPTVDGGPVEFACDPCYLKLMAKAKALSRSLPRCDGCGAEFGAGCECIENKRAIGRGERIDPQVAHSKGNKVV